MFSGIVQLGSNVNQNDAAIIALINAITGETDTTYEDAVVSLADVIGAENTGSIATVLEAISQILEADSD
jgi:hypothetical protein